MREWRGVTSIICILLLGSVLFASGCSDSGDNRAVKTGNLVKVDYIGKFENGTVFDTSEEEVAKQAGIYNQQREYVPITFEVGSGQLIPGFDKGVIGMKVGEEKTITIPPEEAYGEYDKSKVHTVPLKDLNLSTKPEVGQTFTGVYGQRFRVIAVNDTDVTFDTNNELAGKTLVFDIKLVSIE